MTGRTIITVGSRPGAYAGQGRYFDGHSAVARPVRVSLDDAGQALVLTPEGEIEGGPQDPSPHQIRWPYDSLRQVPGAEADLLVLATATGDGTNAARLHLPGSDARLIGARARRLRRGYRRVRPLRLAGLVLAAVAAVGLMLAVLVPALADRLAGFLPPEGEAALGEATLTQVRNALGEGGVQPLAVCDGAAGRAALDRLQRRLSDGAVPVRIEVLDHPMVNAFALPGGVVILFDGLLQEAGGADEVAAVLAHEIGHVAARDPTRIALRSAGSIGVLGLLFGDFAGGALVLVLTERLIAASYTQEAEAAADAHAHRLLIGADLSPGAIATFFERIQAGGDDTAPILQHFLAHPQMEDRIGAARAAIPDGLTPRPALDPQAWADLKAICD